MMTSYIHRMGWFVGLVLLQVLILNNVHIAGYATPFLYVYFILKFASGTSRNELMLWAFFLGLTVDIFSDTPGMNAAATVFLAFVRPTFLRLFTPRDTLDSIIPSIRTMGISSFLKFAVTSVFVHHLVLLGIEFFSFSNIPLCLSIYYPSIWDCVWIEKKSLKKRQEDPMQLQRLLTWRNCTQGLYFRCISRLHKGI